MEEMIDLKEVVKALLQRWWVIFLTTVLFACAGFAYENMRYVPSYSTTIKLYVNNDALMVGPTKVSISSGDIAAAQSLVHTYREILTTYETYEKTMEVIQEGGEELSREYSFDAFLGMLESDALNETEVFYIRVTCAGEKADRELPADVEPAGATDACLIADAITVSLIERIENVINSSTASKVEGVHRYTTSTCDDVRTGAMAGMVGLILSAAMIFLLDVLLNDKLQSEEWLSDTYGEEYSVLSVVPNAYQGAMIAGQKKASITNISFMASEAYQRLRTNIFYSLPEKKTGKLLGVTSAVPSEGKTFTSLHLACSIAREGHRTLLVECDMRRPEMGNMMELHGKEGLSEFLIGKTEDIVHPSVLHENLSVVMSGFMPPNPADLLSSAKIKTWLQQVSTQYDYVILDLPPVLAVADPLIVAQYVDAMIFVTKHNSTHKKHIISSIKQLKLTKVHILGFVYNDYKPEGGLYYKRNRYGYIKQYEKAVKKSTKRGGR